MIFNNQMENQRKKELKQNKKKIEVIFPLVKEKPFTLKFLIYIV